MFDNTEIAFRAKTDKQLKKAYYLFKLIQNPTLTKIGNFLSKVAIQLHIPFTETFIKNTLYEQFCGGETLNDSLPTVYELYDYNIYSILDYSVEGKDDTESFDRTFAEVLENIKWAKEKIEIPFVVFKPTGIGNREIYTKVSSNKALNAKEEEKWKEIQSKFERIVQTAKENDVPVMVDAEESWMQTAVDNIIENLMSKYNREKCIVINTLQMYRTDRLEYLYSQYDKAKNKQYFLGYKIVRGAYMEKERERAEEEGYKSPIQPNKQATDEAYNAATSFILEHQDTISLYAGTHNEQSCTLMIEKMQKLDIKPNYHKIWFGQLYGMSENLSYNLAYHKYNVAKYIPYGPVKEVVPYLSRRAEENTAVAGQTSRELSLIQKEMKRRKIEV